MPITHPSMRKIKPSQESHKQETHIVSDESPESVLKNIDQPVPTPAPAKPVEKSAQPNLPTKQLNMLEELLFLGRTAKEIKIGTMIFEISTLTQKETSDLMRQLYQTADASDLFTIRILTLAHAVKSVNGVALEDIDVGEEYDNDIEKKKDILMNMQKHVIEKLHDSYLELVKESNGLIEDPKVQEEVKN